MITLGIIAVVAALTMPALIGNYQKEKTVSYVKKFYNDINNAVQMSVADNGDVDLWMEAPRTSDYDANVAFLQNYILPYMKYLRIENCYSTKACVYLSYGMFNYDVDVNGGDLEFFVNGKYEIFPRNYFIFQFNKNGTDNKTFVEPYTFNWDGNMDSLKTDSWGGCNTSVGDGKYAYCTKWIQLNNWKIPNDYPWNAKE